MHPFAPTLKICPLFANLSEREIYAIEKKCTMVSYRKGEQIVAIDSQGKFLYVIKSGQVVVSAPRDDSSHHSTLSTLNACDYFGEMSLLTGDRTSARTTASLDTELLLITKDDFNKTVKKNRAISINLSHILSQRLKRTNIKKDIANIPSIISVITADTRFNSAAFSLNLSLSLKAETHKSVLLLDIDPHRHINYSGNHSAKRFELADMEELIASPHAQIDTLYPYLTKCSSVLDVLSFSGMRPESLADTDPKIIAPLLGILIKFFNMIVVNIGMPSSPASLKFIDQCHKTIALTNSDKEALASLYPLLNMLRQKTSEFSARSKLALLYNVFMPRSILGQIRNTSGITNSIHIPTQPDGFNLESQDMSPFVITEPQSKTSKQINSLARELGGARVGIALGSGGARSLAHLGIFKAFEEEGIPIDMISGTSMGSIIGAMYATGIGSAEIEKRLCKELGAGKSAVLDYNLWPRSSLIKGQKIAAMIQRFFGHMTFDQLPIPLYVTCSDLVTGQEVILERGLISRALLASTAIPILMKPVKWKDKLLIDGAVTNSVPADIIKRNGANVIISSTVTPQTDFFINRSSGQTKEAAWRRWAGRLPAFRRAMSDPSLLKIVTRTIGVSSINNAKIKTRDVDVRIEPSIERFEFFDFHRFDEIVEAGRVAAKDAVAEIKQITIKKLLATVE